MLFHLCIVINNYTIVVSKSLLFETDMHQKVSMDLGGDQLSQVIIQCRKNVERETSGTL